MIGQADLVDEALLAHPVSGWSRGVTSARASMVPRAVDTRTHAPFPTPTSRARAGEISQKSSGWSSARCDSVRDMPPAV